ncbi:dihydroxy-acid dehydratase [Marinobacterium rhizophilum]|uniref:Dihydroxy-acid dehydratase n=1 Tax=Marinobacterium rhizophilum TaxID=420402 RepID=A0ABY5HL98_9GAMM|nr:dihydroxy-acid dehydratase [Marinobacterium rhizophilum]UTW12017.1 dihydroxy-acid dehydratase [Marinobacterium rhizophilum]
MTTKKSDVFYASPNHIVNTFRRGVVRGTGLEVEKLKRRPLIAIANSHSELTTGHNHLNRLAEKVKAGILAGGGECAEFNVPAPCDGISMAHEGMNYVLAQRDLIADIIETHVRSQAFDGVVFIAGCDKINPGMMMAAARLEMPAIYLAGGPGKMGIRSTPNFNGSIDHADHFDNQTMLEETFNCTTCGACEIMGTANTFQCIAEALGICLPGSSNIPGYHADKLIAARATGERIVQMVAENLTMDKILTPKAIHNGVVTSVAIGGSTNALLHLPAIAASAGIELPISAFEEVSGIPTLLSISPNGPWGIHDLWEAGGMPAVLKVMQDDLHTDCMTVTGRPLADSLESARVVNPKVIPPRDQAYRPDAGIAVLRGNIAPDGCVVKRAGVAESMLKCSGPARCFNSEDEALEGVEKGLVKQGEIVVLRYQGPKGGPGMPEMLGVTLALKKAKLNQTALITDGRFSGATAGPCVGHICPEAYDGGLIALIEDGDFIELDIPNHRIHLQITDEEQAKRAENWKRIEKETPRGFMRIYRKHVRPACEGAILE